MSFSYGQLKSSCLLQVKIHEEHPEYGLDGHKGYGTKAHMEAIHKHGPSPVPQTHVRAHEIHARGVRVRRSLVH